MTKRKKKSTGSNNNKRFKSNNEPGGNDNYDPSRGYIDTATGQRGAFPGLAREDEPFLGPAYDGLSYLRMVRSEAALVPPLLLSSSVPRPAPPPPRVQPPRNYEVSVDTLDYDDPAPAPDTLDYDDPAPGPVPESVPEELLAPHESNTGAYFEDTDDEDPNYVFAESTYVSLHTAPQPPPLPPHHVALVSKFRTIRDKIHANPPPPTPGIEFPRKFAHKWTMDTPPTMGLLWAMDMPKVIRMTQNVTRMMGSGTRTARRGIPKRLGEWVWALLVRCESAMGPDEVYVIREMGKMAATVLKQVTKRMGEIESSAQGQEEEVTDKEEDELEANMAQEIYEGEPSAPGGNITNSGGSDEQTEEATMQSKKAESGEVTELKEAPAPFTSNTRPEVVVAQEEANTDSKVLHSPGENEKIEEPKLDGPNADNEEPMEPAGSKEEEDVDWGYTRATLDMIISVVGDHFGQRDLLDARALMEIN